MMTDPEHRARMDHIHKVAARIIEQVQGERGSTAAAALAMACAYFVDEVGGGTPQTRFEALLNTTARFSTKLTLAGIEIKSVSPAPEAVQ